MIYYINLSHRVDKNEFMLGQTTKHELHRIEASSTLLDFPQLKKNPFFKHQPEIYLCLISHMRAMEEGLKSESKIIWIAEDDVLLPSKSDLELVEKECPGDAEVIQCCTLSDSAINKGEEELKKGNLFIPWENYKSTALYGITRKAALRFLEKWRSLDFSKIQSVHADHLIYSELKTYSTSYPISLTLNSFESDLSKNIRYIFNEPIANAKRMIERCKVYYDLFKLKHDSRKISYVINIGNAGDALINYSAIEFMSLIKLDFDIINRAEAVTRSNQILVYGGGGNLVKYYVQCRDFLLKVGNSNKVILLPCTVADQHDLLINTKLDLTIYCREYISHEYVKSINNDNIKYYTSEDLAFRLITEQDRKEGEGLLTVFRGDSESRGEKKDNDISVLLNNRNWWFNGDCKGVVTTFFNYINEYEEVHTNRLHVAIAASLLEKKVTLYEGSYYKNRAVYEFSLSTNPKIKMTNGYKESNSSSSS